MYLNAGPEDGENENGEQGAADALAGDFPWQDPGKETIPNLGSRALFFSVRFGEFL